MAKNAARTEPQGDAFASTSPLTLTISEAARRLGVSRGTLHKLVDSGELGFVRLLDGDRRVPASELTAWIARGLVKAETIR